MDKQYVALIDHKEGNFSWQKGELILLDPDIALPYLGSHLTPLYTAIKSGLYVPKQPKKSLVTKIVEDFSDDIVPKSEQVNKKLLQNKLQAQIQAKKAELAKNKNNS